MSNLLERSFPRIEINDLIPEVHYIYVIRPLDSSLLRGEQWKTLPYKIGKTKNIESRISTIGLLLPFEIEVVYTYPTPPQYLNWAEAYLHHKFRHVRVNGEWFALTRKQLDWLDMVALPIGIDIWPQNRAELDRTFAQYTGTSRR